MPHPGTICEWDGTPLLIAFFDTCLMDLGLYSVLDYLLWQAIWPDWQICYKPWWTLSAMVFVISLRLVAIALWPMSTSEYLEKSSDYIHQSFMMLMERVEKKGAFPLKESVETNHKIRPMLDESERLNNKLSHSNLGFIWVWWAARRLYYETYGLHKRVKSRAFSYSLKIHMEEAGRLISQEAQKSKSGMHESYVDGKVHSTTRDSDSASV